MEIKVNSSVLALAVGDITMENTDAVVNAANEGLRGGGGVDGAIHRAGGPEIMAQCRLIGFCRTGQAVITTGGNLKAKYVIHTVGPVFLGGVKGEAALLKSAYLESIRLAAAKGLKSVSFPSLSTGAYGYPLDEAARIALKTIVDHLRENTGIELVRFVLFDQRIYDAFADELKKLV